MTTTYFANHQQTTETAVARAMHAAIAAASPNPVRDIALQLLDHVNPFAAWLLRSGAVQVLADAFSPLCDGEWVAVQAMVSTSDISNKMDELEGVGAVDILVFKLDNCRV